MSSYRNSRRLPPEIYRRRRIAALVALLVLAALVWAATTAIGNLFAGPATQNSETTLPEDGEQSGVVLESGALCPTGTVAVEALVGDAEGNNYLSFEAKETPHIWFTLTNTNSVDCTFNAGAKVQYFTILSGEQTIWSSKQCDRSGLEDAEVVIKAGETLAGLPQPWEKVFSSDSGCGADQPPVVTGGASYHLKAEVSGELSTNEQQFVLN